jgi:hypothetical protein
MDELMSHSTLARITNVIIERQEYDLSSVVKKKVTAASVSSTTAFPTVGLALQLEVPTTTGNILGPKVWGECTTTKCLYSEGGSDFSNRHLVTHVYSGSSVMSPNRRSLLWPSVAMVLGDIISLPVAIVTI